MTKAMYKISMLLVLISSSLCIALYDAPLTDDYYTQALLNMDSSSGGIVTDQCDQNVWRHHDMQLYNGASLVAGQAGFGNALSLDGIDDYAQTVYSWAQDRNGLIVEVWIWVDSSNSGTDYIASSGSWRLYTDNNGSRLNFIVFDAKDNNRIVSRTIPTNTWLHARAEYNEGAVSLSIINYGTATATTPKNKMYPDGGYIYLGDKTPGYGEQFKGKIDDLRISSPQVTFKAERGKNMVECEFLDVNPYDASLTTDNCKYIAGWCAAALWLGMGGNVSAADITTANSRLDDLDNPAYFEQITRVQPADDSGDLGLYWALPTVARIISDPVIYNRTTTAARASLQNILTNFVAERDRISDAAMTDSALWTMYKSMNHDWLIKSTFLLTAQYYKKIGLNIYADRYTAQQHYDAWVAHLTEKLKQLAARGIDPEVASPAYLSITLEGLFNIRDLSEDKCLAMEADKFITLYLADAAAESYHGIRGGGKTRCYKPLWASNPIAADWLAYWTHLLANDPPILPRGGITNAVLGTAMSCYTPPAILQNLIADVQNKSFVHTSRRPARGSYTVDHQNPVYHFIFPSDIRRYTYGNSKFILGSFAIKDGQAEGAYYTFISEADQWMGLITSGWQYSRVYFQADTGSNSGYNELTAIQDGSAMLIKRQEFPEGNPLLFCYLSDDFRKNVVGPNSTTSNWVFAKN